MYHKHTSKFFARGRLRKQMRTPERWERGTAEGLMWWDWGSRSGGNETGSGDEQRHPRKVQRTFFFFLSFYSPVTSWLSSPPSLWSSLWFGRLNHFLPKGCYEKTRMKWALTTACHLIMVLGAEQGPTFGCCTILKRRKALFIVLQMKSSESALWRCY